MKAACILFLVFIVGAYAHGVLLQPTAWWKTASRERPCGGASYNPDPSANWPVGSTQTMKWWVIALDGAGTIFARLNTAGQTDFQLNNTAVVNLTVLQPPGGYKAQGVFYPNVTVPNVKCTGPDGVCILQVFVVGGGGWYSCATINVTCKGCAGGSPVSQDDCVKAENLSFCPTMNNQNVLVPAGQTALQLDSLVSKTYTLNQPNPNVFANGNSTKCQTLYHEMLCELYFDPCSVSPSNSSLSPSVSPLAPKYTSQQCQAVMKECQITEAHKDLYDCSVFPSGPASSSPSFSPSFSLSFSLLVGFLVLLFLF